MERWHSMTARQVMEKLGQRGRRASLTGRPPGGWSGTGQINWTRPGGAALLLRLLGQFQDPMILVLLGAAGAVPGGQRGPGLAGRGHHPHHRGGERGAVHHPGRTTPTRR